MSRQKPLTYIIFLIEYFAYRLNVNSLFFLLYYLILLGTTVLYTNNGLMIKTSTKSMSNIMYGGLYLADLGSF